MTLRHVVDVMQEGSLYVLLLLLPFSKATIEVSSVFLIAGWLVKRLFLQTRHDTIWVHPPLRPLLVTLVAYLAVCAASIVVSHYPDQSLRALFSKWIQYAGLFVVAADLGGRPGVARQSLTTLAASSVFVLIEGLSQERLGRGLLRGYRLDFFDRMTGPYENPVDLATYLMVLIPLLLASAIRSRIVLRRLASVALLIGAMVSLGKTMALGAWLGLGAGLGVASAVCSGGMRRYSALLLFGAVATWSLMVWRPNAWNDAFALREAGIKRAGALHEGPLSKAGKTDRWVMWQAALGMIRDRPLLGHGLNTFMANYLDYWVGGERQPRYAHNCYLQIAAETGIVGLALFVAFLWQLFARLLTGLRHRPPPQALLLSGLSVGLLAFVLQAGVDTNFYSLRQAALFWTLAGLALGYAHQHSTSRVPALCPH